MSFEWFIGLRYLKAKRKQTFISLITLISILGVTVGVMALIIVIAVMTGMQDHLREKILGINSHILILEYSDYGMEKYREVARKALSVPHVVSATPFTYHQVMLSAGNRVSGLVLRGVDPSTQGKVSDLEKYMVEGNIRFLDVASRAAESEGETQKSPEGIILGNELAKTVDVVVGDTVKVISPLGRMTPGGLVPKFKTFKVVGIFQSGMFEYDSGLAFTSIRSAQKFFQLGDHVTGVELKLDDIYRSGEVSEKLTRKLGFPYYTRDWVEMNRNLFSALKLEKIVLFIILTLIIFVAAFNIVSTLIMVVMEKGRDIAILKSMGATSRNIMKIFLLDGLIIGFLGTVVGCAGGLGVCHLLEKYRFIKLPSDVYYLDTLPVQVEFWDVFAISLAAILITFLATIYPSWNASRLDPAEALRYE